MFLDLKFHPFDLYYGNLGLFEINFLYVVPPTNIKTQDISYLLFRYQNVLVYVVM